jgi:hypothetical protein
VELAPVRPNVELRVARSGEPVVVFAFPYDAQLVDAMRAIPGRRFDWEEKEWLVPQHEVTAVYVADVVDRWPGLLVSEDVTRWLGEMPRGWLARVTTRKRNGSGEFVARTLAGPLPGELAPHATEEAPRLHVLPFTEEAADALLELDGARLDPAAHGCATRLRVGIVPPPALLVVEHTVEEAMFALDTLWDTDAKAAFGQVPGADARASRVPVDPWALEGLEHFIRTHGIEVAPSARPALRQLRAEHDEAAEAIRRSRSRDAQPPDPPPRLEGGELAPFQWAGVRYALETRRTFLADEQGLGKTVQALAALEADAAFPAVVVCPASLKLTWEREAAKWLPHRSRAVVSGRQAVPPAADLTIVNYEIVADHRPAILRTRPNALVLDESHYCKNPRAKRTKAVRQLADALPRNALRLALSGTPVTNGPGEIVPQLRILGRLEEFGTGARLERRFKGNGGEERLHWHLRRRCFVRRLKKDVLPQLPAKRRVVVPVALTNEDEYRLAEDDVVAWLRTQPYDLSELDAKIARTLRAERLAQLNALKQLAAHGKLAAATAWIHDFLESGEPLIVFAHHTAVQQEVLNRFPQAAHLIASDSTEQRAETVERFQSAQGPQLLVASTLVAGHGITLTRASNVAFLELGWTPAQHDQAEDRCHRIGQHDAVTAWYLLAADTIDETIAELLEGKRSVVDAVTDGRRSSSDSLVEQVASALREGTPRRHLRSVA